MISIARMNRGDGASPRIHDGYLLVVFLVGLALSLSWRSLDFRSFTQISAAVLKGRSGIGAGELLVMFVLFWLALGARDEELMSGSDLAILSLASVAFAFPFSLAAGPPTVVVALKFMFGRQPRLRSIGQLLLALAFYEWLGPILFHILSPFILRAEAMGVQILLYPLGGFSRDQLMISGPNGHSIIVESQCSAFHNLSFATLIWISLLKLGSLATKRGDWLVLAAMAVATVVLNTTRIALMAQSYPMYDYWHNGAGATIVSITMLAAVIGIFLGEREFLRSR
jgi:hypothetical protein